MDYWFGRKSRMKQLLGKCTPGNRSKVVQLEVIRKAPLRDRIMVVIGLFVLGLLIPSSNGIGNSTRWSPVFGYTIETVGGTTTVTAATCPPSKVILGQCDTADYVINTLLLGQPVPPELPDHIRDRDYIRSQVL